MEKGEETEALNVISVKINLTAERDDIT